ncbi:MAG TPA: Uma2 family endonuclease [Nostocaceae cyanobacterium]|nr:Uma2 family endonuclease [Nostocaceae cyanobacterium]
MSLAKEIDPYKDDQKDVLFPTEELYSDEPPLESDLHLEQMNLLIDCLKLWWENRNDFYAAGNLTIYFSPQQLKNEDFRGPDFFVVLDTDNLHRDSWVVWQENGKYPNIIVELLSPSTASTDRGLKKEIYQDIFQTPEYFWFSPKNLEFAGFILINGKYQPIESNSQGWLWSQQLNLYLGIHENQLRYFTPEGELVPTYQELADQRQQNIEQEKQRADEAQLYAEQEKQRADEAVAELKALKAKLRELNIDPNSL